VVVGFFCEFLSNRLGLFFTPQQGGF